ncbi:hypothetical protein WMY93_032745 [Mugilogobius chulae]|uniref:Uncharacterized protein n=1 Tax=Mugilogobius chulae TaxID=88201 RepID=A0AAW0MN46_9GOBI
MAQNEGAACTRIVQCVEKIARPGAGLRQQGHFQAVFQWGVLGADVCVPVSRCWRGTRDNFRVSANIALEAFLIRPSTSGLSCTVHQRPSPSSASPIQDVPTHVSRGDGTRDYATAIATQEEDRTLRENRCSSSNVTQSTAAAAVRPPVSSTR